MSNKGIYILDSMYLDDLLSHFLGPPPINYTTHPRCTALTYGGTQATSVVAPMIVTGSATATSSTVDGHDHTVNSLGKYFDGVLTIM